MNNITSVKKKQQAFYRLFFSLSPGQELLRAMKRFHERGLGVAIHRRRKCHSFSRGNSLAAFWTREGCAREELPGSLITDEGRDGFGGV